MPCSTCACKHTCLIKYAGSKWGFVAETKNQVNGFISPGRSLSGLPLWLRRPPQPERHRAEGVQGQFSTAQFVRGHLVITPSPFHHPDGRWLWKRKLHTRRPDPTFQQLKYSWWREWGGRFDTGRNHTDVWRRHQLKRGKHKEGPEDGGRHRIVLEEPLSSTYISIE